MRATPSWYPPLASMMALIRASSSGPMGAARAGATTAGGSAGGRRRLGGPAGGRRGRGRDAGRPERRGSRSLRDISPVAGRCVDQDTLGRCGGRRGPPPGSGQQESFGRRRRGEWPPVPGPRTGRGPPHGRSRTHCRPRPGQGRRRRLSGAAAEPCRPARPRARAPANRRCPAGGARNCSAGPGARRQLSVLPIPSLLIPGAGNGLKDCPESRLSPQVRWKASDSSEGHWPRWGHQSS